MRRRLARRGPSSRRGILVSLPEYAIQSAQPIFLVSLEPKIAGGDRELDAGVLGLLLGAVALRRPLADERMRDIAP